MHAGITLFKDFLASAGRRFRYSVAMNAPNILIKRTCKIGMDATSKSDQKPIFDFPSLRNLVKEMEGVIWLCFLLVSLMCSRGFTSGQICELLGTLQ